jgi:hypothetical protein
MLILACLCEGCELIAPLSDFLVDAIGYVTSRAAPDRKHIGLRCPACKSKTISEGETAEPTPEECKLSKLRYAIHALDVSDELKGRALEALDADDQWGQELIAIAAKAA